MAKVSMTKLGLIKNQDVLTINHNDQEIEVKQYLPINDKLTLISQVINESYDGENNFANPVMVSTLLSIKIVEFYTNINITDKAKEDPAKLYDLFSGSDLLTEVMMAIPKTEMSMITNGVWDSIEAFYKYRNSVMGVLDVVSSDYSSLDLDAQEIYDKIADPKNLKLTKDILTKLG